MPQDFCQRTWIKGEGFDFTHMLAVSFFNYKKRVYSFFKLTVWGMNKNLCLPKQQHTGIESTRFRAAQERRQEKKTKEKNQEE